MIRSSKLGYTILPTVKSKWQIKLVPGFKFITFRTSRRSFLALFHIIDFLLFVKFLEQIYLQTSRTFLKMLLVTFLLLTDPASKNANPACITKQKSALFLLNQKTSLHYTRGSTPKHTTGSGSIYAAQRLSNAAPKKRRCGEEPLLRMCRFDRRVNQTHDLKRRYSDVLKYYANDPFGY